MDFFHNTKNIEDFGALTYNLFQSMHADDVPKSYQVLGLQPTDPSTLCSAWISNPQLRTVGESVFAIVDALYHCAIPAYTYVTLTT